MAGIEGVVVASEQTVQAILAICFVLFLMSFIAIMALIFVGKCTSAILKGSGETYTLLADLSWEFTKLKDALQEPEISYYEPSASSLVPVEADKSDGKGVMNMKWFKVGVDEKTGEAEVIQPEERRGPYHGRRGPRGRNERPTINKLEEKDISYIMAKEHRCPRCGILMVYIGLTKSRALEAVVLACPNCNHREGYSRLSYRELRVF